MADIKAKRAAIEKHVLDVLKIMEPEGYNVEHYKKNVFGKMTDKMFAEWMEQIRRGESNLYVYVPGMKVSLRPKNIIAAAKYIGLALFERIRIWDDVTGRSFLTPNAYLVLRVPIRRLVQTLEKKMSVPDSDRRINPTTGQVVKPDKGSTMSMTQGQTLDSKGLVKSLMELTNIRGGNTTAYATAKAALAETGEARIADLNMSDGIRSQQVARVTLQSLHLDNNL